MTSTQTETPALAQPPVQTAPFIPSRPIPSPAARIPRPKPIPGHGLLHSIQSLLYIVVTALFIITFTAQPFRIPSESMEPTLLVGDFLLVNKQISPAAAPADLIPAGAIHRGDLIVFHYPVNPALHLVKRVIGLPGDRLRLRNGRAVIDGRALSEPYAVFTPSSHDPYRDEFPQMSSADPSVASRWWIQMRSLVDHGDLTVPANSYFVLGDNRNDSEDSRYWGFVPRDAIVGKPFLVYFSLRDSRLGTAANSAQAAEATPGILPDTASPTDNRSTSPLASLLNFARWDRTFHVIH